MTFSIIIPVYNDSYNLGKVLEHLSNQSLSKDYFEVIVVDNGSNLDYAPIISKNHELNLSFIVEDKFRNSPYSCRNRGLELAKSNIIVFLDVTCWPDKDWLSEALQYLEDNVECKIMAGEVYFRSVNFQPSSAEIVDSCENIRMKHSVENKQVAKTANLFIYRSVFDELGQFPEGVRSGGDIEFTAKASKSGYKIYFNENAFVKKEARSFRELMIKQERVGKAHARAKNLKLNKIQTYVGFIQLCAPPNPIGFRRRLYQNNKFNLTHIKLSLLANCYFTYYALKIKLLKGQVIGLLKSSGK